MELKLLNWDLSQVTYLLVSQFKVGVEEKHDEHLVSAAEELVVFGILWVELRFDFSMAQGELPVQLPAVVELVVVELAVASHRDGEFTGQVGEGLDLLFLVVWPMASGQHFNLQLDAFKLPVGGTRLEFSAHLIRILDVTIHDLKSLSESNTAFFFQFD